MSREQEEMVAVAVAELLASGKATTEQLISIFNAATHHLVGAEARRVRKPFFDTVGLPEPREE